MRFCWDQWGFSKSSRLVGRNHAFSSSTDSPPPFTGEEKKPPSLLPAPAVAAFCSAAGPNTPVCGCGAQYLSDWGWISSSGTTPGGSWSSGFLSYMEKWALLLHNPNIYASTKIRIKRFQPQSYPTHNQKIYQKISARYQEEHIKESWCFNSE